MRGFELRGAGPSSDGSALGGLFRFFSLKIMKNNIFRLNVLGLWSPPLHTFALPAWQRWLWGLVQVLSIKSNPEPLCDMTMLLQRTHVFVTAGNVGNFGLTGDLQRDLDQVTSHTYSTPLSHRLENKYHFHARIFLSC